MIVLDRRYGVFSGRVWGLIVNFCANTLALYGLAGYLRNGEDLGYLIVGLAITLVCIVLLARPVR